MNIFLGNKQVKKDVIVLLVFIFTICVLGIGYRKLEKSGETYYREFEVKAISPTATPMPKVIYDNEIEAYIAEVFGDETENAFKVLKGVSEKGCAENRNMSLTAKNYNKDGTIDHSPMQVNSVHLSGREFPVCKNADTDWKANVRCAHKIQQRYGWSAWTCSTNINVRSFWQ